MVVMLKMKTSIEPEPLLTDKESSETTFSQALRDKYVHQEELEDKLKVPKDRTITTEITFVGFGTISNVQRQLKRLTNIDLSGRNIELAGELDDLGGSLNRVQILNLADNSMAWKDVVSIIPYVPNLRELILTKNRLKDVDHVHNSGSKKSLNSLTLGRIRTDWTSIVDILSRIWSSVEQLDLWDSHLNSDSMKYVCHNEANHREFLQGLKVLKLSHNHYLDLAWITHLGPVDNLLELDVSHCQLQSIDITDEVAKRLTNLQVLNISYNNLDCWKSISTLYYLKNLVHLICHENPLFISEKFAKPFTIGRLDKLRLLNREEITIGQRRDSEILYLRRTFPEYQSHTQGKNDAFKSHHPRYEKLVDYYGLPEDLIKQKKIDKYITVDLSLNDKIISRKLPCDMRISNVKMLCKKMFNLKPSNTIQITCCDKGVSNSNLNYVLDKDGQTLHFFSVKNGDKLLIETPESRSYTTRDE